jgi:hypothetical protein
MRNKAPKKSTDAFFAALPEVEARLLAGDRQVPNWRWFWFFSVISFLCACIDLAAAQRIIDLDVWAQRVFQAMAIICALVALAFHQVPKLKVWKNGRAKQEGRE